MSISITTIICSQIEIRKIFKMLLSTNSRHEKNMNLIEMLKLVLQIFQQYFTPPPLPWNKCLSKTTHVFKHTLRTRTPNSSLE